MVKRIEIKEGARTIFKIVPDDYEEDNELQQSDLTTSDRKSIGFSDISKERWNEIFGGKNARKDVVRTSD